MARERYQEGFLGVRGKGPKAKYYVVYRVYDEAGNSRQIKETIGLVSSMSKRKANSLKSELVAEKTNRLAKSPTFDKGATHLRDFYKSRFLPMKTHWSDANRDGFSYIMDSFILPKFGDYEVDGIDKVMIQALLNSLAAEYSQSTIRHVRGKMVEVFEEAVDQEYINRNPAKKTNIPIEARKPHKPVLSAEQLVKIIDAITDGRDKALFMCATFCAFRSSEVFGMPWGNFYHDEETGVAYFMVNQIAYRGKRHMRTKNESSEARVHISARTLNALLQWKKECKDVRLESLIFQSNNKNGRSKEGAPMCPSAFLRKRVQPIATRLGIPFQVNFRATRRTAATLAQESGASLGSAQGMLRHSTPQTTAQIYTISIPESVKQAVNGYEDFIYSARKSKSLKRVK